VLDVGFKFTRVAYSSTSSHTFCIKLWLFSTTFTLFGVSTSFGAGFTPAMQSITNDVYEERGVYFRPLLSFARYLRVDLAASIEVPPPLFHPIHLVIVSIGIRTFARISVEFISPVVSLVLLPVYQLKSFHPFYLVNITLFASPVFPPKTCEGVHSPTNQGNFTRFGVHSDLSP